MAAKTPTEPEPEEDDAIYPVVYTTMEFDDNLDFTVWSGETVSVKLENAVYNLDKDQTTDLYAFLTAQLTGYE